MLFCKLTSPVTVNVCQVRNLYISETTIPITPNAPKLLLTTRFLTGNHTPKTNKMTDTIPIGLSRFIKPVISCTPFNPPYWLNNIGNKLIRNAIDRIIFFFIHSHSFAKFQVVVLSVPWFPHAKKTFAARCVLTPRPQTSCPSSCGCRTSGGSGQGCPAGCSGRCRYVPALRSGLLPGSRTQSR